MRMSGVGRRVSIGIMLSVSTVTLASCTSGYQVRTGSNGAPGKPPGGQSPSQPIRPAPGQPVGPAVIKQNAQAVTADRLVVLRGNGCGYSGQLSGRASVQAVMSPR